MEVLLESFLMITNKNLESIDISEYIDCINWVIVGGEKAYKKGRIMEYLWVKDIYS